jgi:hypothetical protein
MEAKKKSSFVSFNDASVPVGKRKVLYVKWLMSKQGKSLSEAKLAAYRKFGNTTNDNWPWGDYPPDPELEN